MTVEDRITHLMDDLKNGYKGGIAEDWTFLRQVICRISALVGELYGQIDTGRRDFYLHRVCSAEDTIRSQLLDPDAATSIPRWDLDKEIQERLRRQLRHLLNDVMDDVESSGAYGLPLEIYTSLKKFKIEYPDPAKAAFIMMDFAGTDKHKEIEKTLKETMMSLGVIALLAIPNEYHKSVLYNVLTYIYGCGYGIAVFDNIHGHKTGKQGYFNPNVAFELGYMSGLHKPICILKDHNLEHLPTDILGEIYTPFETDTISKIRKTLKVGLEAWWQSDKRLIWGST
jgi:hypothetical protein